MIDLRQGDCLDVMRGMADESVTAIVTDPPYALEFMGKGWDKVLPSDEVWREALRVLKPGGMALVFGGTRTFHRLTCSLEDAGFQIRDVLCWLYGSGFPKSLDVSKAIDKAAGVNRKIVGPSPYSANRKTATGATTFIGQDEPQRNITAPATDAAKLWNGYGTALKPAWEPIVLAMKPLDGTFAANALEHGVAGINVGDEEVRTVFTGKKHEGSSYGVQGGAAAGTSEARKGRWPANVVHDGSEEVEAGMPQSKDGVAVRRHSGVSSRGIYSPGKDGAVGDPKQDMGYSGAGSASRFFYCAKASKKDRGPDNRHPTVKPTKLMRWLVRMVKMPAGTRVLDPFMGSGSTGVACAAEDVDFIGIERDVDYLEIARSRTA